MQNETAAGDESSDDTQPFCLICFDCIQRKQPIWECQQCRCIFHLPCIQSWVRDGVAAQKAASVAFVSLHDALSSSSSSSSQLSGASGSKQNKHVAKYTWNCPKCRLEHDSINDFPELYTCFCRKRINPPDDLWLAPHSCGDTCDKPLLPSCGHRCLLPCHMGPCPPCAKTVTAACYCGQTSTTRRCTSKEFACGKKCGRRLACKSHSCQDSCHPGPCQPCTKVSLQSCNCGHTQAERPCAEPAFQCSYVCGKPFPCGIHTCSQLCHAGECGPCARSLARSCPCGKQTLLPASCADDRVFTCKDTCGKALLCGRHTCVQLCHLGPCDRCRHMIEAACRCGASKRTVQCFQSDFACERKCTRTRNCGRHPCKRKCCVDCPPCEEVCNRRLPCGQHRCNATCHSGPCYPCALSETVACACGKTVIAVPCGSAKFTKPPKCSQPCALPSACHHPVQPKHNCHQGDCPPCKQVCALPLQSCGHQCPTQCHDVPGGRKASVVPPPKNASAGSTSRIAADVVCPPCAVPVQVQCFGEHETSSVPCAQRKDYQCGRPCGRLLSCGNHSCEKPCHRVKVDPTVLSAKDSFKLGATAVAPSTPSVCQPCERPCSRARPLGCTHPCRRACHADDCHACKQFTKVKCHCDLVLLHIFCEQVCATVASLAKQSKTGELDAVLEQRALSVLRSCQNDCPKKMVCGHPCQKLCHDGACSESSSCAKKVTVRCDCKRIKQERVCQEVQRWQAANPGKSIVPCDEGCRQILREEEERQQRLQEAANAAREETAAEAAKKPERRPRKPKEAKAVAEAPFWKKNIWMIVSAAALVACVILIILIWRRKAAK